MFELINTSPNVSKLFENVFRYLYFKLIKKLFKWVQTTNFKKIVATCLNMPKHVQTCPNFFNVFRYLLGTSSSQQGEAMKDHAQQELLEEYFSSSGVGAPGLEGFVWLSAFYQIKPSSSGAPRPEEEKYSSRSSNRALSSIASPCREDDEPNI